MKKFVLGLIFLSYSVNSQTLHSVSLDGISPYRATFDFFAEDENKDLTKAGKWTDEVSIQDSLLVRTVERESLDNGVDLIRTVAALRETGQPSFVNQWFGQRLSSVYYSQFDNDELTQIYIASPTVPARTKTDELPNSIIETGLQGVLAMALPFSTQSEIELLGYSGGAKATVNPIKFSVLGTEIINVMGQNLSAWKVHQPESNWTYWVRTELPYLVKVSHPSPSGTMLVSLLTSFSQTGE